MQSCFGRDEELKWLRAQFDAVTTRDAEGRCLGPRMAVVLAESGIGKSRLVQELYLRLTADPRWDPPEVDYWPPAFGDGGENLRVVPEMGGHVPKGPPRFVWLGARWQRPYERNAINRRSVLPDLRSAVMIHAELQRSHGSIWMQMVGRARDIATSEGLGTVADIAGLPFFGLLTASARGMKDAVGALARGVQSYDDVESAEVRSEVDEVLECLRTLLSGRGSVPTVLWLDDAQWMDPESLQFVRAVWAEAQRHRWPLLLVVTHWEREWRELAAAVQMGASDGTLYALRGLDGVEELFLQPVGHAALADYVATRLPGLTQAQRQLLVDKAGGNFLSMVENVGALRAQPLNFVAGQLDGALTESAGTRVRNFKTNRHERVKQRFQELESAVQQVLGWSSHLGLRFFPELIAPFAHDRLAPKDPATEIDRCVDPYAVLGTPTPRQREFRDQLMHGEASEYFHDFLSADAAALESLLRRQLGGWVTDSFASDGAMIRLEATDEQEPPPTSVWALAHEEQRDLLQLARQALPLPSSPDWARPDDVKALRVQVLSIAVDARDNRWAEVRRRCASLGEALPHELPPTVLTLADQAWLAGISQKASALEAAARLARGELTQRRRLAAELETPESLRSLLMSLGRLVEVEIVLGHDSTASELFKERLTLARALDDDLRTPESRLDLIDCLISSHPINWLNTDRSAIRALFDEGLTLARSLDAGIRTRESRWKVCVCLTRLGSFERKYGELPAARILLVEGLSLARELDAELGNPETRNSVSECLSELGDTESALGDLSAARACLLESLAIARAQFADFGTSDSRAALALTLNDLGQVEEALGNLHAARTWVQESLAVARALDADIRLSASQLILSIPVWQLGKIEEALGNLAAARELYEEDLALQRALVAHRNDSWSQRDLRLRLGRLGGLCEGLGDLPAARDLYTESLRLARALVADLGTPESRRDLTMVLYRLGGIEEALGDLSTARARFEEDSALTRGLAIELGTPQSRLDLYISLSRLAGVHEALGDVSAALALYKEGLSLTRENLEHDASPDRQLWVLRAVTALSSCLGQLDEAEQAHALLFAEQPLATSLEDFCQDQPDVLDDCATFWETTASVCETLGDFSAATQYAERGAALRARIDEHSE